MRLHLGKFSIAALSLAAVCYRGSTCSAAEALAPAAYAKLRSAIVPGEGDERWREIPWGTSLWDARRQAAAEGKPILLWEMDGHPLGCT